MGYFLEACKRKVLKVNAGKSRVMILNGQELECEVHIDGIYLEHASEFQYLLCVFWMNQVEMRQSVVRRW